MIKNKYNKNTPSGCGTIIEVSGFNPNNYPDIYINFVAFGRIVSLDYIKGSNTCYILYYDEIALIKSINYITQHNNSMSQYLYKYKLSPQLSQEPKPIKNSDIQERLTGIQENVLYFPKKSYYNRLLDIFVSW